MDEESKMMDHGYYKLEIWKAEIKTKMRSALSELNVMHKDKLDTYEQDFQNMRLAMPSKTLKAPIDIVSCTQYICNIFNIFNCSKIIYFFFLLNFFFCVKF